MLKHLSGKLTYSSLLNEFKKPISTHNQLVPLINLNLICQDKNLKNKNRIHCKQICQLCLKKIKIRSNEFI